jgi:transcriptional regulator with XRE-family HTH domain
MGKLEKRIGQRIRAARERLGLTQEEVASQLKLSGVGYGGFERGDRQVSIDHLIALTHILDKPITYFLDVPSMTGLSSDEEEVVWLYRAVQSKVIRRAIKHMLESAIEEERASGIKPITKVEDEAP